MPVSVHVPAATGAGQVIRLDGEESHHLLSVLRAAAGDPVRVLNGAGGVGEAVLQPSGKREASVRIQAWTQAPPPSVRVTLLQALAKGERTETILRKAVELGASGVTLVQTEHAVARLREDGAAKRERWRGILASACKQSGNPWLPRLELHGSLDSALAAREPGELLFGDLTPGAPSLRRVLRDMPRPASVTAAVGPEGDFSPRELALLRDAGGRGVNLGPLVLRTDTAAVHLLSILAYEWMDAPPASV